MGEQPRFGKILRVEAKKSPDGRFFIEDTFVSLGNGKEITFKYQEPINGPEPVIGTPKQAPVIRIERETETLNLGEDREVEITYQRPVR